MLSCTHDRKTIVGKNPTFYVFADKIRYDSILVFYLFSYLFVLDLPVQENPVYVNPIMAKQKIPGKRGI